MIRNEGADEFVAATISYAPLVRGYAQCACDIVPYGGRERQAVGQLLSLREAIRRDGFGENEFDDVKWRIYKELKEILSRSEEHTSELQSRQYLVCRLLLEKKKNITKDKYKST